MNPLLPAAFFMLSVLLVAAAEDGASPGERPAQIAGQNADGMVARWQAAVASRTSRVDWAQIAQNPRLLSKSPTPEGLADCLTVEAGATVPVNIVLPAGTRTVGLWILADKSTRVTFELTTAAGTIRLEGDQLDAPGQSPQTGNFHPRALCNDWVLWVAGWDGDAPVQLRSITLHGSDKGRRLLGPVLVEEGARPYQAAQVWKIKNFDEQKGNSLYWCASKIFEYGFDRAAFLRPMIWQRHDLAQVSLEYTRANGEPLTAQLLNGEELRQPVQLPSLPEGTYFIRLSRFGKDRRLLDQQRLVYQVLKTARAPVMPELPAPAGLCAVNGLAFDGATAVSGAPFVLKARLDSERVAAAASCDWQVEDTEGMPIGSGAARSTDGWFFVPLTIGRPGGYRLTLTFTTSTGKTAFRESRLFGIAPAASTGSASAFVAANDDGRPFLLNSAFGTFDPGVVWRLPQYTLPSLISAARRGGNSGVVLLPWNQYEPVRGVINDHLAERLLDMTATPGNPAWLGLGYAGDGLPEWLWFEELMSQDLRTIHLDYHYVSPFGEQFSRAQRESFGRLFRKYGNDPRVGGWFFAAGPSEGFLTDTEPLICDYAPHAVRRLRLWLQERYKTVEALNQAWGTVFAGWTDVTPPYPAWQKEWETSRAWWDFMCFKQSFVNQRLNELQTMLREIDPVRPALMYAKEGFGSTGALAPIFRKNRVRYSNGGGETFMAYVQSCIMVNHDVPVTCEGHYVMPNSGSVNLVLANALLSGRFGGNNIMWGLVWAKRAHDDMPETREIFRTTRVIADHAALLGEARPVAPLWAGYYSATTSLVTRRTFRLRENDAMKQLDLVGRDLLRLPESWVDDSSDDGALARFPLLMDCSSSVLTQEAAQRLARYVENGGTLVASLHTGRFLPGSPEAVNSLMNLLGATEITAGTQDLATCNVLAKRIVMERPLTGRWRVEPEILARDAAGLPLLWMVTHGKGRAIISAGQIRFQPSAEWVQTLIEQVCGSAPIRIVADAVVRGGVLRSGDSFLVVLNPLMKDRGLNASLEDMADEKPVQITLKGEVLARYHGVELVNNTPVQGGGDTLTITCAPGKLYLLRLSMK